MKKNKLLLIILCILLTVAALAACTTAPDVTISFEANGGEDVEPLIAKEGESISLPTPTREHYEFVGWFFEDLITQFTLTTMPQENTKLFAMWKPLNSSIITFNTNGGSAVADIIKEHGEEVFAPNAPTKDGYSFVGWYVDDALTMSYVFNIMPINNITLYAKWTRDAGKALVGFYGNDKLLKSVFVDKGTQLNIQNSAPDLTDFEYSQWTNLSGSEYQDIITINSDTELYTKYHSKGLKITGNTVTGYEGSGADVVLPQNTIKVAEAAFMGNTTVKTLTFGGSEERIESKAFMNCTNLVSVFNTSGIAQIDEYAFFNCTKLKQIDVSALEIIKTGTFNNCLALNSVTLGDSLIEIGDFAFANCTALPSVSFTNTLITIGDYAFLNCESIREFYIPANLLNLGKGALQGCNSLKNITVSRLNINFMSDEGNNIYGNNQTTLIFYQQSGKSETSFVVPEGVVTIEENAFIDNMNLTHISLPSTLQNAKGVLAKIEALSGITLFNLDNIKFISYLYGADKYDDNGKNSVFVSQNLKTLSFTDIEEIPDGAFYGCINVNAINGIENVTFIGKSAFAYTSLYTEFTINEELQTIKEGAFEGAAITGFNIEGGNENFTFNGRFLYNTTEKALIKVMPNVEEFDFTIEGISDIETIYSFAFEGCGLLTEVAIPQSVSYIGNKAFVDCVSLDVISLFIEGIIDQNRTFDLLFGGVMPSLSKVEIMGTPTVIPDRIFELSSIKRIALPASVLTIGTGAFAECQSLVEVTGLDNVVTISRMAFYSCSSLRTLDFGSSLEFIGDNAFTYSGITSVTLPKSLVTISAQAFYGAALSELIFDNPELGNLDRIEDSAFRATKLDNDLILPASLTYIGYSAFNGTSITGISFAGTTKGDLTVASLAFSTCYMLNSVTFLDNLKVLGESAFSYCEELEFVTLGDEVTHIGGGAFFGNTKLEDITFPTSLIYVGSNVLLRTPWMANQPDGIVYNGNAAIGFKGEIGEEVTFLSNVNDIDITVISTRIFQSPKPEGGYYDIFLENVYVEAGYKNISEGAFALYTYLNGYIKNINLPHTVETIGDYAFAFNAGLEKVVIGTEQTLNQNMLSYIGQYVFTDCRALKEVYIYKNIASVNDAPTLAKDNSGNPTLFKNQNVIAAVVAVIYVPNVCLTVFRNAWLLNNIDSIDENDEI